MIYGNYFLEIYRKKENDPDFLLESISIDIDNMGLSYREDFYIEESFAKKLNKFLSTVNKRKKEDEKLINSLMTKLRGQKINIKNITGFKSRIIEEIDWESLYKDIVKGLEQCKCNIIYNDTIKLYNNALVNRTPKMGEELEILKNTKQTMFYEAVFNPTNPKIRSMFSDNTDKNNFLKEFSNLFKHDNLRKLGYISEKQFTNQSDLNKYLDKVLESMEKLDSVTSALRRDMSEFAESIGKRIDILLDQQKATKISNDPDSKKLYDIIKGIYSVIVDIYVAYLKMYDIIRDFAIRLVDESERNIKRFYRTE